MPESLAKSSLYQSLIEPQEKTQALGERAKSLFIGLPKELAETENRICLTPDAVSVLVRNGHEVVVEKGAGEASHFSDQEYSEAGASIAYSPDKVFEANIILKVNPPTEQELALCKPGSTIFSAVQFTNQKRAYFEGLVNKKMTAVAFESLQDKVGNFPIVRAMSEIAGSMSILIASEYLSGGQGTLLGGLDGIPPTSVVIIGAGTVGEFAARTAIGLGADIKVFDMHLYRLQRLRYTLGQHIYTSIIDSQNLAGALRNADVVVAGLRAEKGFSPMVVTEEMVKQMKENAVVVDVAIDQGGCVETSELTTHRRPTFTKHGVIHYAVPNIASRVGKTASQSLSNIFTPIFLKMGRLGGVDEMILSNQWFLKGVYAFKGNITHQHIARKFDLRHRDLRLLLAARI
ncbi:alanine dehydrogenase [Marinilongibacter aquaticus]|uniref:alanine dehydrogenase n=1 Tax=Marinilongibacter aquaticus TaxID=2975157 RepID=UPI0021BD07F7|nr:alanine dehydrogenase [Marinilongibacter aquaticus]UBM60466.1 alanine dehydrogenase [Marinilongibacter aquaticus]